MKKLILFILMTLTSLMCIGSVARAEVDLGAMQEKLSANDCYLVKYNFDKNSIIMRCRKGSVQTDVYVKILKTERI